MNFYPRALAQFPVNRSGLTGQHGSRLDGLIFGHVRLLGHQVVAILAAVVFTVPVTYGLAVLIWAAGGWRVPVAEQIFGVDPRFEDSVEATVEQPHPSGELAGRS